MNFIGWMIVTCEVLFWVVILLGLTVRYVFHNQRVGFLLLALTPLIDLVLIMITGMDLYNGATATVAHGLAAVYIAISISFGKSMIKWMDERFQYYILKSSLKPLKRTGIDFAKHYATGFFKHVLAYIIGAIILLVTIYFVNDPVRTEKLFDIVKIWALVVGIDFVITISYFIWPKQGKTTLGDN
ncbi:hypothetical protein [Aquibacillus kalidii]|uniref:hypothetical protein n=1 Tax=Aquibacillus kalidii TaxID=2762597 RepID=UPI001643FB8A|nr:hypothetical protein [Aquibacillus kalidii]